jgi:PUA-domain protein
LLIGQRKVLKHRDARNFLEQFSKEYGSDEQFFGKEPKIEASEVDGLELIFLNGKPSIIRIKGRLFPTLTFNEMLKNLPKVVVDMGAIPHICNGADIMAPGVKRIEGSFASGSVVVVSDDKYGKFLAVGETLQNSDQLNKMKQGKIVVNRHYVGDDVWNAISKMTG